MKKLIFCAVAMSLLVFATYFLTRFIGADVQYSVFSTTIIVAIIAGASLVNFSHVAFAIFPTSTIALAAILTFVLTSSVFVPVGALVFAFVIVLFIAIAVIISFTIKPKIKYHWALISLLGEGSIVFFLLRYVTSL